MNAHDKDDRKDHVGPARACAQELTWTPSSGEGSEAALRKLKRAERVRSAWRRLRSDAAPVEDD